MHIKVEKANETKLIDHRKNSCGPAMPPFLLPSFMVMNKEALQKTTHDGEFQKCCFPPISWDALWSVVAENIREGGSVSMTFSQTLLHPLPRGDRKKLSAPPPPSLRPDARGQRITTGLFHTQTWFCLRG